MRIFHENIKNEYSIKITEDLNGSVPHWHQRVELLLVHEGIFSIDIGKQHFTGRPGDLFVIRSGEIHHLQLVGKGTMYVCTFDPVLLCLLQPEIHYVQSYISRDQLQEAGIAEQTDQFFQRILKERADKQKYAGVLIQTEIFHQYYLLVRWFESDSLPEQRGSARFRNFQLALSYIEQHYADTVTLQDIARVLNYSPAYVSRVFVQYTGTNFKKYLDNRRVYQASKLLKSADMTVSNVAAQCGFDNIRTFNNTFKRIAGKTPSQFKTEDI